MRATTLISSCHWKTLKKIFLLVKEKIWKRVFNTNSELSQNGTEKQIMPFKTTVNWLFNDIWCYLVIACFDWKIVVFQKTVVRVYYILKLDCSIHSLSNFFYHDKNGLYIYILLFLRVLFLHYSHVSFFFVSVTFLLLCHNYVINAFITTTHLTLFFGTFKLHRKVTLQLRCFLICHCAILRIMWQLHFYRFLKNIFLITLKMRFLLVRSNFVRKSGTITLRVGSSFLGYFYVVHLHNCITYWNNITATSRFRLSLWHTFITSQLRYLFVKWGSFLMTSELRWVMEIVGMCELCMELTLSWSLFF